MVQVYCNILVDCETPFAACRISSNHVQISGLLRAPRSRGCWSGTAAHMKTNLELDELVFIY